MRTILIIALSDLILSVILVAAIFYIDRPLFRQLRSALRYRFASLRARWGQKSDSESFAAESEKSDWQGVEIEFRFHDELYFAHVQMDVEVGRLRIVDYCFDADLRDVPSERYKPMAVNMALVAMDTLRNMREGIIAHAI